MTFLGRLSSKTLDAHPCSQAIKRILSTALEAAEPGNAVRSALTREGNLLRIGSQHFQLDMLSNIYIVAFGKAAPAMAEATREVLGSFLSGGIVVSKYESSFALDGLSLHTAGHPVPDGRSQLAAESVWRLLTGSGENDLVLFLISGGGSALITSPIANVSLSDLKKLTSLLLGCGARIDEINVLRRALDRIKGGGLARCAYPSKQVSLILSDVVDSPIEAIASGTTVTNPTSNADARAILEKYDLLSQTPPPIMTALAQSDTEKHTPTGEVIIVGSNRISAEAARYAAQREGFDARVMTTTLQGEAAEKGRELALSLLAAEERPLCLIVGGETTVTLVSDPGEGGRNQEMALSAVEVLDGANNRLFITVATDGDDGPTDAAGAVVSGETYARAKMFGLDPQVYLSTHNSYAFFDALGDLLKPGPTGTNVNDLIFLFTFSPTKCRIL
jgi:hydroxypyruvate reductase